MRRGLKPKQPRGSIAPGLFDAADCAADEHEGDDTFLTYRPPLYTGMVQMAAARRSIAPCRLTSAAGAGIDSCASTVGTGPPCLRRVKLKRAALLWHGPKKIYREKEGMCLFCLDFFSRSDNIRKVNYVNRDMSICICKSFRQGTSEVAGT